MHAQLSSGAKSLTTVNSEIFSENFIFRNSVKTHIFDVEIRDKGVICLYK